VDYDSVSSLGEMLLLKGAEGYGVKAKQAECFARFAWLLAALCPLGACNPQSGFQSAADGIDPMAKSYVAGPGSRLATGPYDRVSIDLDLDDQVHVLARRRDDGDQSLTVFGLNMQTGCTIAPNARTWFPPKPTARPRRLLPYLDAVDDNGTSTLYFTNIDCQVEPYSLSNVRGLIGQVYSDEVVGFDAGFVVKVGGSLVLADPWSASTRVLANDFRRWRQVATASGPYVLWGDSQIVVLDDDMNELGRFGNHVTALSQCTDYGTFWVEDDDGLHVLQPASVSATTAAPFDFELVDPEACGLRSQFAGLGWALVHSPCNDPHLVAEQVSPAILRGRRTLEAQADFGAAEVMGDLITSPDPTSLAVSFLTDVDPTTGLGTLFVAQETGEAVQLGSNAPLYASLISDPASVWAGIAMVDMQAGLARMIHWNWDGSTEVMAENVEINAEVSGFLTNYNGHSGDLARLGNGANLTVVQQGIPDFDSSVYSSSYQWELHLEHYDGVSGDLMFAAEPALTGSFKVAASRVPLNQYQELVQLPLDGFAYLGGYDEKALSGSLFVQNVSLGSTMLVASHVSDFAATYYPFPGILYAVPSGDSAGIWFARGK
jgi:hypothetical protein